MLKKTVVLALLSFIFLNWKYKTADTNPEKFISFEKLLKEGKLNSVIAGIGGHQENCIEFTVKNNTSDSLFLWLEPGRRLTSEDTTQQDILIVKEKKISLPPLASESFFGYGFCCESSNSSPQKGNQFSIGYMTPPSWQELAQVINKNDFSSDAVQHAVWVVSNNHPLSSVAAEDESLKPLRNTLAKIKGVTPNWYTLTFAKDTAQLFSGKPEKLTANLDYYLKNNAVVSINIRNKKGTIVAKLIDGVGQPSGSHFYKMNLDVSKWPAGDYEVFIYEDHSNLNQKKTFTL